ELERYGCQSRVAREPGEPGARGAPHEHAMTAPRELAAQIGDHHARAGRAPLMRELEDRERPVSHGPKLVAYLVGRMHIVVASHQPLPAKGYGGPQRVAV